MASPGVNLFDIDNERKSQRNPPVESPLRPCERKSRRNSPVESLLEPRGRRLFSLLSGIGLRHVAEVGVLVEHAAGVLGTECQRTGQRGYQIP